MDQRNRQLEVDYTIGRDIRSEDISKIAETLQEWCESCETVLATIEEQIEHANANKTSWVKHQDDIESEVCVMNSPSTLKIIIAINSNYFLPLIDYKFEENIKNTVIGS